MKDSKGLVRTVLAALFAVGVFSLTGCGRTDDGNGQADTAVQYEVLETEPKGTEMFI